MHRDRLHVEAIASNDDDGIAANVFETGQRRKLEDGNRLAVGGNNAPLITRYLNGGAHSRCFESLDPEIADWIDEHATN